MLKVFGGFMELRMKGNTFADYAINQKKRVTVLDALHASISWVPLEKILKRILPKYTDASAGRKFYPALMMLKILFLQTWYDLSDEAMENSLSDRISFRLFTGLSMEDDIPDQSTICRFRNLLVEHKVHKKLLDEVNRQLEKQGKLVKTGIAVDASIISSAARPRTSITIEEMPLDRDEEVTAENNSQNFRSNVVHSHDREASWIKKGKKSYYGYKVHSGVDVKDGFILSGHITPANCADCNELEQVLNGSKMPKRARVYADKAYPSKKHDEMLRVKGYKNGIMSKGKRNKPLQDKEKSRNNQISKKRFIVERSFGTIKLHYKFNRASYIGIEKVEAEFTLIAMAHNLKKSLRIIPMF